MSTVTDDGLRFLLARLTIPTCSINHTGETSRRKMQPKIENGNSSAEKTKLQIRL